MAYTFDLAIVLSTAAAPNSMRADFYAHGAITNLALGDVAVDNDAGTTSPSLTKVNSAAGHAYYFKPALASTAGSNAVTKFLNLHVTDVPDGFQGTVVVRSGVNETSTVVAIASCNPREVEYGTGSRDTFAAGIPTNFAALSVSGTGLVSLTATEEAAIATAVVQKVLTETYAANGAAPTHQQILLMIYSLLAQFYITGTTLSAKKLDGTTEAMTFTLDDATNPTGHVRAT